MKRGNTVRVLTSKYFSDRKGKVTEVTNQGRVTVHFGYGDVGVYNVQTDIFEILE